MSRERLDQLMALYSRGSPIVMLTAYDFPSARIAAAGGVDVILVGDSAAMTVLGYSSTRDISVDELLMLTRAARRGAMSIPVIGDLPYGSYEDSDEQAVRTARRFADDGGCDAVKLEGGGAMVSRARAIIAAGVPVFGHVGLLPQSVRTREGYRARGREPDQAIDIVHDAEDLSAAGVSALIVEAVPAPVTAMITKRLKVPVIGIGAGAETGGQVLVYHDLLGFTEGRLPRFVRQYASARAVLSDAVRTWAADVRERRYPATEHTYPITPDALRAVEERLG
jgi:3-methyl-2-oxobutanoate hydroxymethyltransferase